MSKKSGEAHRALADAVELSRRQCHRRVKEATGETPAALMKRMRLERAAQLVEQGAGSISEIAYTVGFNSPSHFSRAFREHFGVSPSKY